MNPVPQSGDPGAPSARVFWLVNLRNLAILSLAVLVVAEVGLRAHATWSDWRDSRRESWAVHDEELGYTNRPGWQDINLQGLRGPPVDEPKQRFRILMLGDSVTFYGDDAADTFPGHLARSLAGESGAGSPATARRKIEVLNAGVRGYTNYQQVRYLELHGVKLAPDVVGIAFVLNDLHRILHRFKMRNGVIVGQTYAFDAAARDSIANPLVRLAYRSEALTWAARSLANLRTLFPESGGPGFTFAYRPDFAPAWKPDAWAQIDEQLGQAALLAGSTGFRLFLVGFPFADQYRPDYLARDRDYVLSPQRRLAEITARLGIPYLDLYDDLDPTLHMEPDRIHLTRAGRIRAGERIARFLVEKGLVPEPDVVLEVDSIRPHCARGGKPVPSGAPCRSTDVDGTGAPRVALSALPRVGQPRP